MSPSARPRTWWRSALGWTWRLGLIVPLLLVTAAVMLLFGVAGTRFAWFHAPAILAGGGGSLAWLLFKGHPGQRPAALAVVGVGTVLAAWLWWVTPPMPSRLASYVSSVDLPRGTNLAEVDKYGNPLCFDTCPSVTLRYHVPGTPDEVERAVVDAFRSDWWSVEPAPYTSGFNAVSSDGSKIASFFVDPREVVEGVDITPTTPPGYVVVEILPGENPCFTGSPLC